MDRRSFEAIGRSCTRERVALSRNGYRNVIGAFVICYRSLEPKEEKLGWRARGGQ